MIRFISINVDEFDKSHDLKTPNIIYFENNLGSEDILADHPNIFEVIKGHVKFKISDK